MFLKRIELQGFKSFADKAIIHLDSDVIGIVGPNGCGKSNINDAIRWVLGEQSVKALRGNSMSDVIFSGSQDRKAVNTAEVTLVFDNSKHYLNIDFEEVSITRRLHRTSGEGEYFINATPCRLKDIQNLVMDSGLGRDSLSIISQGNVSSFAEAKPEDRRALFEEAAGVAKYKKRKNESLSKLNRTQENLVRLEDIIIELERQINPLRRQAKKAEIFQEKKAELERIEVSVIVDEIETLMSKMEELKKEAFDIETKKAMHETTIQVHELKNEELRRENSELDRDITKLQDDLMKIVSEIQLLDARKVELDEKRKYALESANNQERLKSLKAMMEEAKYEYDDRKQREVSLQSDYQLLETQLNTLENHIMRVTQQHNESANSLNRYRNRKDVLENLRKQPFAHQQGVRSIMEAQNSLDGVLGVVSTLLIPKDSYEMAVANALGGATYQIVTEDEMSARHSITFLKKNQSGRATFLPLTVLKKRFVPQEHLLLAKQYACFLGVASDFVECEQKFDIVKDSLLGNVLVCQNLINANELAKALKYNYKIVTLDGDVVHRGGSMSGGKTKDSSSPVTIMKELNQISSQIDTHSIQEEHLKNQLFSLQNQKNNVNNQILQCQLSLAKLQPVVEAKRAKYEKLKDEVEELSPDESNTNEMFMEDDLIVQISKAYSTRDRITSDISNKRTLKLKISGELERKEVAVRELRRELNSIQIQERDNQIAAAKCESDLNHVLDRLSSTYEMTYEFAKDKKIDLNMEEARAQVIELRKDIQALGNVNLDAPEEFEECNERYQFLTKQRDDLNEAKAKILEAIDEMDEVMTKQFKEMFDKINHELNDVFRALFGGGKAELFLVDPDDILNTGIDIDVQPPGKYVKNIRLFSGGEKSLIAICVLFSILKARTIPLCIFDEVEAALDQANVERFAKYISQFRGESQFILVTHRPGSMAQCDALYGVTMQKNGVSEILKVKLQDAISMIDDHKEAN